MTRTTRCLAAAISLQFGLACSDEDRPAAPDLDENDKSSSSKPNDKPDVQDGGVPFSRCASHAEGCPCDEEGAQVDCGKVIRSSGDYISCSVGKRTCTDGAWGECIGDRVIQIASDEPPPFELSAVPTPQTCINNPCDPYCMEFADGPEHVDPGGPIVVTDAGVSLSNGVPGAGPDSPCNSLQVVPTPQVFVVESLSGLPGAGSLFGLLGQYYGQRSNSGIDGSWTPDVERIDGNVDFYWGSGSPASGVGSDNFSVRWTGTLVPPSSGSYTFHLTVSDGARLWLDGALLLDAWSDRAPSELTTSTVALTADQAYDFRLETYENTNTATASLAWTGPATANTKAPIDTIYFRPPSAGSPSCQSAPACSDATLQAENLDATTGAPVTDGWNIYSDGYIYGDHAFTSGQYTITVTARSEYIDYQWANMVVWIGGASVFSAPVDSTTWKEFTFPYNSATAGGKEIQVEFTNDYNGIYGDRNLHVDKIQISCPSSSPCTPSTPEPTGPDPTGTPEDPITSGQKQFSLEGNPATCVSSPVQAAWTLDKLGSATIDSTGLFKVLAPVAGDVTIKAYSGGFVSTGLATIVVNVREDGDVSDSVSEQFDGPGSGNDPMEVLYPYADTVFPLGIRAPVVQWDKGGTNAAAVRVALTAPNFSWEQIIPEPPDGRFEIPLGAWKALEQSAKGGDAAYVVQRLISGSLKSEVVRPFRFATAPLRGQIIYTEYGRGSNEHAYQMAANPGSTSVAVNMFRQDSSPPGTNGQCPVCHSVSADGSTFVTSDAEWSGYPGVSEIEPNGILNQLSDYSTASTYQAGIASWMDFRGFAWAPITPDGKYAFATSNFWGNTTSTDVGFSGPASTFPSTLNIPTGMKSGGNGTGLLGNYYPDANFAGTPWLRLDPYVDFDWGSSTPNTMLNADDFSVRWEGEVQGFYSEDYTFYVATTDGVRLTVGGDVIIDQLAASTSSATTYVGAASLDRGAKTPIVLELAETGGNANVELQWESKSTPRAVVPQTQLYWDDVDRGVVGRYFANRGFDSQAFERVDSEISAAWDDSSPSASLGVDEFSIQWEGRLDVPFDGKFLFCVYVDDYVEVQLDGSLVLASTVGHNICSSETPLASGLHELRVKYYEISSTATMQLEWEGYDTDGALALPRERIPQPRLRPPSSYAPPTNGLRATYYDTRDFNATTTENPTNARAFSRIEPQIAFDWGSSTYREEYYRLRAGTDISARFTGLIEAPCTGFTDFRVRVDDGAQLWIDRVLIASRTSPGDATGFKHMTEGEKYDLKLDWNNASASALLKLEWRPCGAASWALVPTTAFFPTGDSGTSGLVRLGGDNHNDIEYWAWQLTKAANVASTDVTSSSPHRWGLEGTAMMVPSFAPDGSKLVFVDGDQDGGAGWRKGLSIFDFDQSAKVFSHRRQVVNTWPFGDTIKWPTFESDSRSVVYSGGPPTSRCCVNLRYTNYGNMAPTDNYESPGRLYSVDSASDKPTPVALSRASDGERAVDANKAWQPTMLPVAAGGYRWVVFTSTRPYGNTVNTTGQKDYSNFGSYSPMLNTDQLQSQLWVAAVEDSTSADDDRSHPAFWLPNQRFNEDPTNGMINERGFWALDACRPIGNDVASTCEVDEDCCGGGGSSPTAICKIDLPASYPLTRHCADITDAGTCEHSGQFCGVTEDCCPGLVCADSVCQEPPGVDEYTPGNFDRVYQATCNFDATPEWHFFDWQATTPDTNAYIDFYVQTADDPDAFVALPPAPVPVDDPNVFFVGRAIGPSSLGSWIGTDIGAVFEGNSVKQYDYVKVTARLVPNQELTKSPVLHDFRLHYSCPPNQ